MFAQCYDLVVYYSCFVTWLDIGISATLISTSSTHRDTAQYNMATTKTM
ncbi:MAG: hypothetical protein PF590_01240 [Candidatus Delongbacteria bacterium]|jgi:hypothetical protein|nr:hypothetical protein [Candidatus Delongbacteria bacterium]